MNTLRICGLDHILLRAKVAGGRGIATSVLVEIRRRGNICCFWTSKLKQERLLEYDQLTRARVLQLLVLAPTGEATWDRERAAWFVRGLSKYWNLDNALCDYLPRTEPRPGSASILPTELDWGDRSHRRHTWEAKAGLHWRPELDWFLSLSVF